MLRSHESSSSSESADLLARLGAVLEADSSYCLPPASAWTPGPLTPEAGLGPAFTHTEESLGSLAGSVHQALDLLPAPGTCLLSLLWLCDTPLHTPDPQVTTLTAKTTQTSMIMTFYAPPQPHLVCKLYGLCLLFPHSLFILT